MPLNSLLVARHGFRLNWLTTDWESPTRLPRDPPLAATGIQQADELAVYLQSLPEQQRPTAIFSSPYYRCIQTSQPVARALDIPIYLDHGLSEWYQPVAPSTGLHPRPAPAQTLAELIPDIDPSWSSTWIPPRVGEDVKQVHDRVADFLSAFIPRVEALPSQHTSVLLMTHAATAIAITRVLVGNRDLPMRVGCCTITDLKRLASSSAILANWEPGPLGLASGAHLSSGELRDWGFEDVELNDGQLVTDPGVPGTENETDDNVGPQFNHTSRL